MSDITLDEAKNYAKQMFNFFKAFKFLDQTLEHAVAVDELVKAHDVKLEKILSEAKELEEKKATLIKEIAVLVEQVKAVRDEAKKLIAESQAVLDRELQQNIFKRKESLDELSKIQKDCEMRKVSTTATLDKELTEYKEKIEVEKTKVTEELNKELDEHRKRVEAEKARLDALRKDAEAKLRAIQLEFESTKKKILSF